MTNATHPIITDHICSLTPLLSLIPASLSANETLSIVAADTHPLYTDIPSLRKINSHMFVSVRVVCIIIYKLVARIPIININPIIYPVKLASLKNINQNAFTHMFIPKIQPIES